MKLCSDPEISTTTKKYTFVSLNKWATLSAIYICVCVCVCIYIYIYILLPNSNTSQKLKQEQQQKYREYFILIVN